MKPASFFNIVIKIIGLYFLVELLVSLPQFISSIISLFQVGNFDEAIGIFVINIIIVLLYTVSVVVTLFKTNYLIKILRLDKGFGEEVLSINTHRSITLMTALVVIAGILLVNEIPNLCRGVYQFFLQRDLVRFGTEIDYSYVIIALVKIIIAFLLIGERRRIVNFFESDASNK